MFELMGLTLPPSLQQPHPQQSLGHMHNAHSLQQSLSSPSQTSPQQNLGPNKHKKSVVKMKVRLPDNNFGYLLLRSGDDIEQKIKVFLDNNDMLDHNLSVSSRLIDIGRNMLARAEEEDAKKGMQASQVVPSRPGGGDGGARNSSGSKVRKCKARIQLPTNKVLEAIVWETDDAMEVAKRLAEENGLSVGFQHKIWEQLQRALENLKNS